MGKLLWLGLTVLLLAGSAADGLAADIVLEGNVIRSKFKTEELKEPGTITGFAPAVAVVRDWDRHLTLGFNLGLLLNFKEGEVARTAAEFAVDYALLGQTRKVEGNFKGADVVSTGQWAVTGLFRAGLLEFHANTGEKPNVTKIKGTAIQGSGGLGFRFDVSDRSSVGVEALKTIVSFAMSVDELKVDEMQTGLYYRFEF